MGCLPYLWSLFADEAKVGLELSWRVKGLLAFVALISSGVRILAKRTSANNEAISKPEIAVWTVALGHFLLERPILLVDVQENLLSYLSVPVSGGPPEIVKSNVKPFVNLLVYLEVVIAHFLGCLFLLHGFHFSCCAVFVSAADIQDIGALEFFEAGVDICGQDAADNIAQMRDVIDIW